MAGLGAGGGDADPAAGAGSGDFHEKAVKLLFRGTYIYLVVSRDPPVL